MSTAQNTGTLVEKLRGRPFIGRSVEISALNLSKDRTCSNCMMRDYSFGMKVSDCETYAREAHKYFHIAIGAPMPTTLEGREVGHYCPFFKYTPRA